MNGERRSCSELASSAGEAANDTKALSLGQLTDELQGSGAPDGQGQVSKWGFVPGNDDTTNLDLERNGMSPVYTVYIPHVHRKQTLIGFLH